MPWVWFEPAIPAFERAKTVHALDRGATVTGAGSDNAAKLGIKVFMLLAWHQLNKMAIASFKNI
jgi:hypothetical protein